MRSLRLSFFLLAILAATACGGRQSVASRSAAAYDEARTRGTVTPAGEHGGHAATETTGTMSANDHAAMAGMDHSTMTGMDHAQMTAAEHERMTSADHSQMDHSQMTGADHARMGHEPAAHSAAAGHDMQHGAASSGTPAMAGMDHAAMGHAGATAAIPPGGLWGPVSGAATAHGAHEAAPLTPQTVTLGTAPAPTSRREMERLQPSQTLRPDAVDLAAPISLQEAARSSGGATSHEGHPQPQGKKP